MRTDLYSKPGAALVGALFASLPAIAQPEDPTICKVEVNVEVVVPTCGELNGAVIFNVSDGIAPYSFYLNGEQVVGEVYGVGDGAYSWYVVDQVGCDASGEFVLACEDDCEYRTQTMGGWGADPRGSNPGAYLHANFAAAFPGGLTIGCDRVLHLSTAQAVTDFLPSGSTPMMLENDVYMNPGGSYQNVLAGQLVAATLSVTFDAFDPDFGASGGNLGDLEIASGTFAGMTVSELIAAANLFIGNCSSPYTASELNDALTSINESFVGGGEQSGDFLICGGLIDPKTIGVSDGMEVEMSLFPVPAQDILNVNVRGAEGMALMRIMDTTGRLVADMGQVQMVDGRNVITLDVNNLPNGLYLLEVGVGSERVVERFSVQR